MEPTPSEHTVLTHGRFLGEEQDDMTHAGAIAVLHALTKEQIIRISAHEPVRASISHGIWYSLTLEQQGQLLRISAETQRPDMIHGLRVRIQSDLRKLFEKILSFYEMPGITDAPPSLQHQEAMEQGQIQNQRTDVLPWALPTIRTALQTEKCYIEVTPLKALRQ